MRDWHPMLATIEVEPGHWEMHSQTGGYAIVRLLDIGGERGYRATTYLEPRQLVGYFVTFRAACEAAHQAYLRGHGPGEFVGYPAL